MARDGIYAWMKLPAWGHPAEVTIVMRTYKEMKKEI
jgi:hypothetical protein